MSDANAFVDLLVSNNSFSHVSLFATLRRQLRSDPSIPRFYSNFGLKTKVDLSESVRSFLTFYDSVIQELTINEFALPLGFIVSEANGNSGLDIEALVLKHYNGDDGVHAFDDQRVARRLNSSYSIRVDEIFNARSLDADLLYNFGLAVPSLLLSQRLIFGKQPFCIVGWSSGDWIEVNFLEGPLVQSS